MTTKESEYLKQNEKINKEISQLKLQIKEEESTKVKIDQKTKESNDIRSKIDQIQNRLSELNSKLSELSQIVTSNQQTKDKSNGELSQVWRLREIYELKLNLLTRDSEIKGYLNQLLNKDISKDNIQDIVQRKIKEEKEFLK